MIRIGLNTSCLQKRSNRGIREILEFVFSHGFTALEYRDEYPFSERLTAEDIHWARTEVEKRQLPCSLHLSFYDLNLSAFREELRLAAIGSALKSVRLARELGATTATVHGGNLRLRYYGDEWKAKAEDLSIDSLRRILEECERCGIRLLLENLNLFRKNEHQVYSSPESMLRAAQELGGRIGFTLDVAHIVSLPMDVLRFVEIMGVERIGLAHLNDNDFGSDQHLAVGEGKIDYRGFMRAYLERGWSFPLLCETQTPEYALASKLYLEALIAELAPARA